MPWGDNPKGWYTFSRGSSIHIKKGPKNYLADVSIYSVDSLSGKTECRSFKGRDLEFVALKALAFLRSRMNKAPIQVDLGSSGPYPVRVKNEDDLVSEVVEYGKSILSGTEQKGLQKALEEKKLKDLENFSWPEEDEERMWYE